MFIPMRTQSDSIDYQEPYHIKEEFTLEKISEFKNEEGKPSPKWQAEDKTWRLICFPKGYKGFKDYFSVYLDCVKLNEDHKVTFKIQTVGGKKTKTESGEYTFSHSVSNRGYPTFIPLKDIDLYTVDDKITLSVEIKFEPPKSNRINYRKAVGYIGLLNQGATCYLNSVIQCLFHNCAFRKIIFDIPIGEDEDVTKSVPLALQHLFILMEKSSFAPSTLELTKSFGWNKNEVFYQQDVSDFMRELLDNLQQKIKNSSNADSINKLFGGKLINSIQCLDFEYSSENVESFLDIALPVKDLNNLDESLNQYISNVFFIEDNMYKLEGHGYVNAFRGTSFLELPPVLRFQLNKYETDKMYGVKKILDRFEYPFELDMTPYLSDKADMTKSYVYELFGVIVHSGEMQLGHYFAYIRPTAERKWFRFNDEFVSSVQEKEAIENNFGGPGKIHSAYYLVYIQKSEIERIMSPIQSSDIPSHVIDYYEEWKNRHSGLPPSIQVRILDEEVYKNSLRINQRIPSDVDSTESFKIPPTIKFIDILPEIKRKVHIEPNSEISLWTIGENGFPSQFILLESKIQKYFNTPSRIFVTKHCQETTENIKDARPLVISFYNPESKNPMTFIKFAILDANSNLIPLLEEVKSFACFDDPESKLLTYYVGSNNKAVKVNPELTLNDLKVKNGMIVFQKDESIEISENLVKTYKSIDLIPELRTKSYIKFNEFVNSASLFNFVQVDQSEVQFKLLINKDDSIVNLLRCAREILKLPDHDSVLLFGKDGKKNSPCERPIDFREKTIIKNRITSDFLYFTVVHNISQFAIEQKVPIRIAVMDENIEIIERPLMIMQSNFAVKDVIKIIRSMKIVPNEKRLRVLKLSGAAILKVMETNEQFRNLEEESFRAEVVPDDQLDLPADKMVRVSLTLDLNNPRNGCVGDPFMIKIVDDEKFATTKERISKLAKVAIESLSFAYTNECNDKKKFTMLKDDDVLSKLLVGNKTMIYTFLPVEHRTDKKAQNKTQNNVYIYN